MIKLILKIVASIFIAATSHAFALDYVVKIKNTGSSPLENVPITFAHPFLAGDISESSSLGAEIGTSPIDIQVDKKATHDDGSLRHAVISLIVPSINAGETKTLRLFATADSVNSSVPDVSIDELQALNVTVSLIIGSEAYYASLAETVTDPDRTWLSGPIVGEWIFSAPVKKVSNNEVHPHLSARFSVRKYRDSPNIKIDVVVENNWIKIADQKDYNYDLNILVNGNSKYSFDDLSHYSGARWKQTVWTSSEPSIHIAHDAEVLVNTKAVPSYDLRLVPDIDTSSYSGINYDQVLTVTGGKTGNYSPMGIGSAISYMPQTGGRPDIGPLPKWGALYVLAQDEVSKRQMLEMGDTGGSWPIHYRDPDTNLPMTITDHPMVSSHPNTADKPLICSGTCNVPYEPDDSHQPSFAYVPYLVTGDFFYLEELQFWVTYNLVKSPEGADYRDGEKGLFSFGQLRAQAWNMRSLARLTYVIPNDDPLKGYFDNILENNIASFRDKLITPEINTYGALQPSNGTASARPWQDDFFTWSMGQLVDFGFTGSTEIAEWKARFPLQRMGFGFDGNKYCYIFAATYNDSPVDSGDNFYSDINGMWDANYSGYDSLECGSAAFQAKAGLADGEMDGRSANEQGYVANMQPALATAVDLGLPGATEMWELYEARKVKPDYSEYPNWAIVPRGYTSTESTPAVTPTPGGVLVGIFSGPIQGIGYRTGSLQGSTNENGEFNYVLGEDITFAIGELSLPNTVGSSELDVFDIASANETVANNIARLLLSLDVDGDSSNGIEISDLAFGTAGSINFTASASEFESSTNVLNLIANGGQSESVTELVSELEANAWLNAYLGPTPTPIVEPEPSPTPSPEPTTVVTPIPSSHPSSGESSNSGGGGSMGLWSIFMLLLSYCWVRYTKHVTNV